MTQTKEQRSQAAKKAAATRQGKSAEQNANKAKRDAEGAVDKIVSAAKSAGEAAVDAGKSVTNRLGR